MLICCLRLLYDWWFHLCHLIACICYFVLSIIALIWLVLMALSCAAIRGDFVSILKFPFLSHVQVLSFEILFISRCIYASTLSSMLASPLPPSFLETYSLSTSSLGCNALGIVISFLVLLSICLSSSIIIIIIIVINSITQCFSHQFYLVVFHWSHRVSSGICKVFELILMLASPLLPSFLLKVSHIVIWFQLFPLILFLT